MLFRSDQHPLTFVLRVQNDQLISAQFNLDTSKARVCTTVHGNPTPRKRHCIDTAFGLKAVDGIEFAQADAFPGPHRDLFVVEAEDEALCRTFATYFDGGPPPAGLTAPKSFSSPDAWRTWGSTSYQLDADNDGTVDDVAVMDIEQYLLHGTVIAVFERDSVLTGRVPAPWWGDLKIGRAHV